MNTLKDKIAQQIAVPFIFSEYNNKTLERLRRAKHPYVD